MTPRLPYFPALESSIHMSFCPRFPSNFPRICCFLFHFPAVWAGAFFFFFSPPSAALFFSQGPISTFCFSFSKTRFFAFHPFPSVTNLFLQFPLVRRSYQSFRLAFRLEVCFGFRQELPFSFPHPFFSACGTSPAVSSLLKLPYFFLLTHFFFCSSRCLGRYLVATTRSPIPHYSSPLLFSRSGVPPSLHRCDLAFFIFFPRSC